MGEAENGKSTKRAQMGVRGLKIGPIGAIFQGASFFIVESFFVVVVITNTRLQK